MIVSLRPQRIFNLILIAVIAFNIGGLVWQQKNKFLSKDYWERYPFLYKAYYDSVYANKKGGFIPDETLYSFNGGALIQGTSPILVSPEIPPTGKYIVGLSALIFKNEHTIILIAGILSLVLIYLLGRQIFNNSTTALFPPLFLSSEPIFKNQFIYTPLLDIIHLLFLLLTFFFFNLALKSKRNVLILFLIASLFFGLFISTKFFGVGIAVVFSFYSVLILRKDIHKIKLLTIALPLSVFVLLFSYIRVLALGFPLSEFLGIQKWVFWYNQGHLQFPFSVWDLLLFNRWHVWWGDIPISSDPQWRITWPILAIFSFSTIVLYLFRKIKKSREAEILMAWVVFYLAILSLSDTTARYFVILIPVLYLVSFWGIENILLFFRKNKPKFATIKK